MVSSPMYDRLMKFVEGVEESHKLSGYDCEHSTIIAGMGMMSASVSHFKEYQGFEGQTGEAIDGWIDQAQKRYSSERQAYVTGTEHYVEGRRLLMHAAEDAKLLSPTLLDKATESMRDLAQSRLVHSEGPTTRSPRPARPTWTRSRRRQTHSARPQPRRSCSVSTTRRRSSPTSCTRTRRSLRRLRTVLMIGIFLPTQAPLAHPCRIN